MNFFFIKKNSDVAPQGAFQGLTMKRRVVKWILYKAWGIHGWLASKSYRQSLYAEILPPILTGLDDAKFSRECFSLTGSTDVLIRNLAGSKKCLNSVCPVTHASLGILWGQDMIAHLSAWLREIQWPQNKHEAPLAVSLHSLTSAEWVGLRTHLERRRC